MGCNKSFHKICLGFSLKINRTDIVTFLHRNRDDAKNNAVTSVDAEWIIEKNRNGRTGVVKLLFYPARMEFVPAAPGSDQFGPQ